MSPKNSSRGAYVIPSKESDVMAHEWYQNKR